MTEPKVECPACLGRAASSGEVFAVGEILCTLCHGEGYLAPSLSNECPRCETEGAITCPVCFGFKETTEQRAAEYLLVGLPEGES